MKRPKSAAWKTHFRRLAEPALTGCGMTIEANPNLTVISVKAANPTCRRCYNAARRIFDLFPEHNQ